MAKARLAGRWSAGLGGKGVDFWAEGWRLGGGGGALEGSYAGQRGDVAPSILRMVALVSEYRTGGRSFQGVGRSGLSHYPRLEKGFGRG